MIYSRYTFFEIACDNGVLTTAFRNILKPNHKFEICGANTMNSPDRVVAVYQNGEETPFYVYPVLARKNTESQQEYHERLKEDITRAWNNRNGVPPKTGEDSGPPEAAQQPEVETAGTPDIGSTALNTSAKPKKGKKGG